MIREDPYFQCRHRRAQSGPERDLDLCRGVVFPPR